MGLRIHRRDEREGRHQPKSPYFGACVEVNTYKLVKTESGYTLIFLLADGSEHKHHR